MKKHIVIIGGGTGTSTLLAGLKEYPAELSVIVSTADDGGSSGRLRREFGIIPPGDMRQCLAALSAMPKEAQQLFNYRFDRGSLRGHTIGNLLLAGLLQTSGSVPRALALAHGWLKAAGTVIPMSLEPTTLTATLAGGKKISGEHEIDAPLRPRPAIQKLRLRQPAAANPQALAAIRQADLLVFGPGDLYTSVLPNVLMLRQAMQRSAAKKLLVTNIMTKAGQTDGFAASDFASVLESYLGAKLDVVVVNTQKPAAGLLGRYRRERASFVEPDQSRLAALGRRVVAARLVHFQPVKSNSGDRLRRSWLRHDSGRLARLLWQEL
ncbi:MAG TPA: gluconeogenesis factor YvcK family protein [Patescibacteria group bacterium]|nr:gluconeogenesis factor YvcK family protein [Patescibacteria group bacterium]